MKTNHEIAVEIIQKNLKRIDNEIEHIKRELKSVDYKITTCENRKYVDSLTVHYNKSSLDFDFTLSCNKRILCERELKMFFLLCEQEVVENDEDILHVKTDFSTLCDLFINSKAI